MKQRTTLFLIGGLLILLVIGIVFSLNQKTFAPSLTNEAVAGKGNAGKAPIGEGGLGSYTVPATDKANDHYTTDKHLTEVGQYTVDATGLQTTLLSTFEIDKRLTNGKFTYAVTSVQVLEDVARTKDALRRASMQLNNHTLKKNVAFKVVKVTYVMTNGSQKSITTNGVGSLTINQQAPSTVLSGLVNAGAAGELAAKATRTATVSVLVADDDLALKNVAISFASVKQATNNKQVAGPSDSLTMTVE